MWSNIDVNSDSICLKKQAYLNIFDTSKVCVYHICVKNRYTAAELKGVKWSILLKAYDFWLPKGLKNAKYLSLSLTQLVSAAHNGTLRIIKMQQKGVKMVIIIGLCIKLLDLYTFGKFWLE